MVLERERDIIKLLITQTLGAFCKSHLAYSSQITIDGLVGVTIDQSNVILVTIKESIKLADKTSDNCIGVINIETSDPPSHFQSQHFDESNHPNENVELKMIALPQSSGSLLVKAHDSASSRDVLSEEGCDDPLEGAADFGLDLSVRNRNPATVVEPNDLEDESLRHDDNADGARTSWHETKENSFTLNEECSRRDLVKSSNFLPLLGNKSTSKHLTFPLFAATPHRTSLKKRKIQLLSKDSFGKSLVVDAELGCSALQTDNKDVKVKVECSSPGLDLMADSGIINVGEPSCRDSLEVVEYDSTSVDNKVLTQSSSLGDRWLVSEQLPWADFQNMLVRSWRRNLHEEMLLKPSAHALIESWTNLSDAMSHKRISECVQAILLYEGRYVPVRDIQRLRLSSMTSQEIRSTMEFLNSTREGKVGCYREIRGGIGVFYKCPPHLVDEEFLESFGLSPAIYETRYNSRMVSNATNRHSAVYWYRIETCSPYLSSTEVL